MDTKALYQSWGRNLRAARGKLWSQKELATVCGITGGAICNIEAGRRCPTDEVKWRLAGALRQPVGDLFPWPEEIPPFPVGFVTPDRAA